MQAKTTERNWISTVRAKQQGTMCAREKLPRTFPDDKRQTEKSCLHLRSLSTERHGSWGLTHLFRILLNLFCEDWQRAAPPLPLVVRFVNIGFRQPTIRVSSLSE